MRSISAISPVSGSTGSEATFSPKPIREPMYFIALIQCFPADSALRTRTRRAEGARPPGVAWAAAS